MVLIRTRIEEEFGRRVRDSTVLLRSRKLNQRYGIESVGGGHSANRLRCYRNNHLSGELVTGHNQYGRRSQSARTDLYNLLQDVVFALAHATGKVGRFTLIEKWRNNERLLAPNENPLKVNTVDHFALKTQN